MSDTTAFTLGCTFVSLTGCTSSFLREGFLSRTSNITKIFGLFKDVPVLVLEIVKHILYDIASQGQIVNVLV